MLSEAWGNLEFACSGSETGVARKAQVYGTIDATHSTHGYVQGTTVHGDTCRRSKLKQYRSFSYNRIRKESLASILKTFTTNFL